jgi:sarcosine oxidase
LNSAIIVGAGINGLMIAFTLSEAGWNVLVMDRGAIPNPFSASHGRHRLIHPYTPNNPDKVVAVKAALKGWDVIWDALGSNHFIKTGVLVIEAPHQDSAVDVLNRAQCFDGADKLTADETVAMMPLVSGGEFDSAYVFRDYGVLLADRILAEMVTLLAKRGVCFLDHTTAKSVNVASGSVKDDTGMTRQADCIFVAAGTGTAELLAPDTWQGVSQTDFVAKRCYVLYAEMPDQLLPREGSMPAWVALHDDELWGMPPVPGISLKMGCSGLTHIAVPHSPLTQERLIIKQLILRYQQKFPQFRQVRPKLLAHNHWTQGPKESHIYQAGRGFLVSACSGTGFKFASLIGDRALKMIEMSP